MSSLAAHSFFHPVYLPPRLQAHPDLRNMYRTLDRYRDMLIVSSRFVPFSFVSERFPRLFVSPLAESHFHLGSVEFERFLVSFLLVSLNGRQILGTWRRRLVWCLGSRTYDTRWAVLGVFIRSRDSISSALAGLEHSDSDLDVRLDHNADIKHPDAESLYCMFHPRVIIILLVPGCRKGRGWIDHVGWTI